MAGTPETPEATHFLERIAHLTLSEARTIASFDNDDFRAQLRFATGTQAWNTAYDRREQSPWDNTWEAAFRAGVEPAVAAGDALKARGQWVGPELISSNPEWQDLWSTVWHLSADAIAAVDARRFITASNYTPLTRPLQAALGDEFPTFHPTEFLTATPDQDSSVGELCL